MSDSNKYYFDINPLPVVDDELVYDEYFVMTFSGSVISVFDNYDDAVDLICLIEEFCRSRKLQRKEYL